MIGGPQTQPLRQLPQQRKMQMEDINYSDASGQLDFPVTVRAALDHDQSGRKRRRRSSAGAGTVVQVCAPRRSPPPPPELTRRHFSARAADAAAALRAVRSQYIGPGDAIGADLDDVLRGHGTLQSGNRLVGTVSGVRPPPGSVLERSGSALEVVFSAIPDGTHPELCLRRSDRGGMSWGMSGGGAGGQAHHGPADEDPLHGRSRASPSLPRSHAPRAQTRFRMGGGEGGLRLQLAVCTRWECALKGSRGAAHRVRFVGGGRGKEIKVG